MDSISGSSRRTTLQLEREPLSVHRAQAQPDGQEDREPRFVIAIDYGTTYTGVAWILTPGGEQLTVDQIRDQHMIRVVSNWAAGQTIEKKVPSVYTYSATRGARWGFGVNSDDEFVQKWTKLELPVQRRDLALENLAKVLVEICDVLPGENVVRYNIPHHLTKAPVDVVTDYLTQVAVAVRADIRQRQDEENLRNFPIDLIITRPNDWDHRARNLTFRAVTKAFTRIFPEIGMASRPAFVRMATESEACAQYTLQDAEGPGIKHLRPGDCFIVVDAGGGTVDLMWYQVDEISPRFRFSRHRNARASGGPFGSTCVDRRFIEFLGHRLEESDYIAQDEHYDRAGQFVREQGHQILLERFIPIKHLFRGPPESTDDNLLPLPDGVIGHSQSRDPEVQAGRLRITCGDMMYMFEESVDGILELISEQVAQITGADLWVRTIFLSGGYSNSEYLRKCVTERSSSWGCDVFRATENWTAVARGGVLMGLGIGCDRPEDCIKCPFSIGVVLARPFKEYDHEKSQFYIDSFDQQERAKGHIEWVIDKGDLISTLPVEKTVKILKKMSPGGFTDGRVIVVTSPDDSLAGPPKFWPHDSLTSDAQYDLDFQLGALGPNSGPYKSARDHQGQVYNQVELRLEISLDWRFKFAEVVLKWGNRALQSQRIQFPSS